MSSIGSAPPPPSSDASGQAQAEGTAGGSHEAYGTVVAWRWFNLYGEAVTDWQDGAPPAWVRPQVDAAGGAIQLAYAAPVEDERLWTLRQRNAAMRASDRARLEVASDAAGPLLRSNAATDYIRRLENVADVCGTEEREALYDELGAAIRKATAP